MVCWPLATYQERVIAMADDQKLTSAQLHFIRAWSSGMSQSAAYREAFQVSPDTKAKTVHEAASRLANQGKVKARYEKLVRDRERGMLATSLSLKSKILNRLEELMDHSEQDSNKIRSAELLGKSLGLWRDVVETTDSRSSEELLAELDAMLEQTEPDQPEAERDKQESGQLH